MAQLFLAMKNFFFFFSGLWLVDAQAQNLIGNGDFENYNSCPCAISNVDSSAINFPGVIGWCRPTVGTTDMFNACCTLIYQTSVPKNASGYQSAHSGNGYGGFRVFETSNQHPNDNYREYLQTQLVAPLAAGKTYCVEFYVSPTYNLWSGQQQNSYVFATDDVGAWITVDRPVHWNDTTLSNSNLVATPQIKTPEGNFLSDTALWYRINGTYVAAGGEQWLTIGNFFTDQNTSLQLIYSNPGYNMDSTSYYYLDDVSVTEVSADNPLNDTVICGNAAFTKTLTGLPGGTNYIWNTGDTTQSIVVTATGVYLVTADYGCGPVTDTIYITNQPLLNLSLGNDIEKCDDGTAVNLVATTGFDHYLWSTGDSASSIQVIQSGTYTVQADYVCGTEYDTVNVSLNPIPPPPTVADEFLCLNQAAQPLTASGQNLIWYATANDTAGQSASPVPPTTSVGAQTFFVSQTVLGCESNKALLQVTVASTPSPLFATDSFVCEGTSVQLSIIAPYASVIWSTGDTAQNIQVSDSGWFSVRATNWCGSISDSIHIETINCDACISTPNAFTPNNDGVNDVFTPIIQCPPFSNYVFEIFNRWGAKVFETTDQQAGWDGNLQGVNQPLESYVYLIICTIAETNKTVLLKGNLTLLR